LLLRHRDVPPKVVYPWELHDETEAPPAPDTAPPIDAEQEPPARG
jgi:hypothetical protein